jgi:hypothetical protein
MLDALITFFIALFSADFFKQLLATLGLLTLVAVVLIVPLAGCQPNMEPMERVSNKVLDSVIGPAITKGLQDLDSKALSLQGGMQGIEPGYEIVVEGKIVNGFEGKGTVRAKGLAGQLQGSYSATPGEKSPAKTEGATAPQ